MNRVKWNRVKWGLPVVVAELILLQKSPAPQSHPFLHLHPWNSFYGFAAVLHWYPDGIIPMGFQQFFIGTLNNFHNQKKELHWKNSQYISKQCKHFQEGFQLINQFWFRRWGWTSFSTFLFNSINQSLESWSVIAEGDLGTDSLQLEFDLEELVPFRPSC